MSTSCVGLLASLPNGSLCINANFSSQLIALDAYTSNFPNPRWLVDQLQNNSQLSSRQQELYAMSLTRSCDEWSLNSCNDYLVLLVASEHGLLTFIVSPILLAVAISLILKSWCAKTTFDERLTVILDSGRSGLLDSAADQNGSDGDIAICHKSMLSMNCELRDMPATLAQIADASLENSAANVTATMRVSFLLTVAGALFNVYTALSRVYHAPERNSTMPYNASREFLPSTFYLGI
jgi:hypothetical protein